MTHNSFAVLDYDHLLTTRPHAIRRVFISDLHLSANEPALAQAFLAFLDDLLVLPNLNELYILGDWFDVWVGDDAYLALTSEQTKSHWITPFIERLKQLNHQGCAIYIMHGNRDFLIRSEFCAIFGGTLIPEPYPINMGDYQYRLEHGDALCTDDKSYQRFRRIMRNPVIQWFLLKQPLEKRLKIARTVKNKSNQDKSTKSLDIMDVNEHAVMNAIKSVDCLVHGHTHRPAEHLISENKTRYVLGDWRIIDTNTPRPKVQAIIAMSLDNANNSQDYTISERFHLVDFIYSF